jgi:hypothetical protein
VEIEDVSFNTIIVGYGEADRGAFRTSLDDEGLMAQGETRKTERAGKGVALARRYLSN